MLSVLEASLHRFPISGQESSLPILYAFDGSTLQESLPLLSRWLVALPYSLTLNRQLLRTHTPSICGYPVRIPLSAKSQILLFGHTISWHLTSPFLRQIQYLSLADCWVVPRHAEPAIT
jgi:hypothetical protein